MLLSLRILNFIDWSTNTRQSPASKITLVLMEINFSKYIMLICNESDAHARSLLRRLNLIVDVQLLTWRKPLTYKPKINLKKIENTRILQAVRTYNNFIDDCYTSYVCHISDINMMWQNQGKGVWNFIMGLDTIK